MKQGNPTDKHAVDFGAIQSMVKQGKTVISAEDSAVIDLALEAIEKHKTATFYLKDALFLEIIKRRSEQIAGSPAAPYLEPLSKEEAAKIKADFKIEMDGASSKETCPRCETVYGTYEFIQQGIKEHGEEAVRAVFSLEGVSVLQIHPRQNNTCQNCGFPFAFAYRRAPLATKIGPHSYVYRDWNHGYGCCR